MRPLLPILAILLAACGAQPRASDTPQSSPTETRTETRTEVRERLQEKLDTDPNRALCERIAELFAGGDQDALQPVFDHAAYVERVIAAGSLPEGVQSDLRARPASFEEFGRVHFPEGSRFLCLGTRSLFGEDVIAIRQWTPTRFDYVLLHVGADEARPIDDFMIVSGGSYASESDSLYFSPSLQEPMQTVGGFLQLSYENRFADIITAFRGLPPTLQDSPVAFLHFVNAVFTQEQTGSPLYREAVTKMEQVFADRPYTLAFWRLTDAQRRGDRAAWRESQRTLLELLDDYELLSE